jgi:uncharacterized protein YjbI with pentapeptide repeats
MTASGLGAGPDSTVLSTRTRSMKPLSARTMFVVATVVLLLTCGATAGLLWWVNTSDLTGTELTTARLDAIRMGLSIAVGGGGVFALYLAWRRQRSNEADHQQRERTLEHHRRVADATDHDALERRITELYTKAADQLGSDKAPVRLAGIYALERLAQNNPDQRQTVVNVLCSYLRMPYTVIDRHERIEGEPDGAEAEIGDVDATATRKLEREQEMQVRLAAQRILAKHLRPLPSWVVETFWAGIEIDLTGATLLNFDFSYCTTREAAFDDARFYGTTSFARANLGQKASFTRAWFGEDARFVGVHVDGMALFAEARFEKDAVFDVAEFEGYTEFGRAQFVGSCKLDGAKFGRVDFMLVKFDRSCYFRAVAFSHLASFDDTQFADAAVFDDAKFNSGVGFDKAVFGGSAVFSETEFANEASFNCTNFNERALFGGSMFRGAADFSGALFSKAVNFRDVQFAGEVSVYGARARADVPEEDAARFWPEGWTVLEPETPEQGHLGGREGVWGELVDWARFRKREQ